MPSPSSCVRCSRFPVLVSPSGLCRECAATAETGATSRAPQPVPATTSFRPSDPPGAPSTASFRSADPFATTAEAPRADAPPRPLPQPPPGYDLLDRLGIGGMGEVFLAREHASERLVAMKYVRHPGDPSAFERFLVELRVLARLDHPNIVRVFASDFLRADPYFTMEYLPGGTLARSLNDSRLPPAEAVATIRTVAQAVAAAHAERVIHRDLKPSNILLAADGTPKVADFGLAKRLDEVDPLTVASGGIGTPGYMPPEQISRKNGEIGPCADVYGLGATLYHLLTGRAPFDGDTPLDTVAHVLADPPVRPRALRPELPLGLEAIVLKCLEKDPKDRYPTAAEFVADLDRFTAGQKPVAPPLTPWRRAKRWAKRNRVTAGVLFAVALGVAALVWAGSAFLAPEAHASVSPEAVRKELAKGRPVTLAGETGPPLYHACPLETVTLGKSPHKDGSCYFQAFHYALVELCPAPGLEKYRVEVELRHVQNRSLGYVGFYFGHATGETPAGTTAHALFAATFADGPAVHNSRLPPGQGPVDFRKLGFYQSQDVQLDSRSSKTTGFLPFTPRLALPGPWRKFALTVSPDGAEVHWTDDVGAPGDPRLLVRLSADEVRQKYEHLKTGMEGSAPGAVAAVPAWSPNLPFGIVSCQSGVCFRNVVVTPLP